jgi:hypothetical protein
VRNGEGHVAKEWLTVAAADELPRFGGDHIVRVGSALAVVVAGQRKLLIVVPEIRRVVKMRVDLVQVAEELVEPMLPGNPRSADVPQSPLPEAARRVARGLEDLGHRDVTGPE